MVFFWKFVFPQFQAMNDFDYINLRRQEWDFYFYRDQLEKDDKMYACLVYEYARHVQAIKSAFYAAKNDSSQFDEHGNWHFWFVAPAPEVRGVVPETVLPDKLEEASIPIPKDDPNGMPTFAPVRYRSLGQMILTKLIAPPGFPNEPFLCCDHKFENPGPKGSFVKSSPLQPAKRLRGGAYVKGDNTFELIVHGFQPLESNSDCIPVGVERGYMTHDDVAHLVIDSTVPKEEAMKAYGEYLNAIRPKKETRDNQTEDLLADLRRLGAYRLVQERKVDDAKAFTVNERKKAKGYNDPLFSDPAEWSKAKKQAKAIITAWEQSKTYVMDCYNRNPIPLTDYFGK